VLVPDLRPLSVGEIVDVAIKIWRRHLPTLARIVFVVVAPFEILSALIAASVSTSDTFETVDAAGNTTVDAGALAGWVAGMLTAQIISGLAFLIASAAVLRAVSVAYLGGTPQWRESLRAATGRLGPLIWLAFLMFAGLALAMFAFVIPFFWLGVAWSVAFPVLIAEGLRGTNALARSHRLVRGRWWPTFGALALAFLFQFFIGLILGLPLGFLTANWDGDSAATLAVSTVVSVASAVITTPFMSAVLVLVYFDLRVRKEGFDLQLLSQGVGVPGSAPPAPAPWVVSGNWGAPGGSWPAPAGEAGAGRGGGTPGHGWPAPGSGSPPPGPPGPPPAPPGPPPAPPER
jgi:predicted secreted protein